MSIYDTLNPMQKEAVLHTESAFSLFWREPDRGRPGY